MSEITVERRFWIGNCRGRGKKFEFYTVSYGDKIGQGMETRCINPCGNIKCESNFSEDEMKERIKKIKRTIMRRYPDAGSVSLMNFRGR